MSFQEHIKFTHVHGIISSTRMLGFYADKVTGGNVITAVKQSFLILKIYLLIWKIYTKLYTLDDQTHYNVQRKTYRNEQETAVGLTLCTGTQNLAQFLPTQQTFDKLLSRRVIGNWLARKQQFHGWRRQGE